MKITKIELQQKRRRFNLEIEGKFVCSVSATTLTHYNLYKGKEITEDEIQQIVDKEVENRFFDRAVALLSARLKSRWQVTQYLNTLFIKKKGLWFGKDFPNQVGVTESVLSRLEKLGLINDHEFARAFVEGRIRSRPRGGSQIIAELLSKGISKEIAKTVVYEILPDNDDMIFRVFRKKYPNQTLDLKNRKQIDFLLRKGFDWDDISKLSKQLKDDSQE
ncbi:RecX family transcriptional regulator [bacterium]|nr:RecX family transcriptional regulator [bacterium]